MPRTSHPSKKPIETVFASLVEILDCLSNLPQKISWLWCGAVYKSIMAKILEPFQALLDYFDVVKQRHRLSQAINWLSCSFFSKLTPSLLIHCMRDKSKLASSILLTLDRFLSFPLRSHTALVSVLSYNIFQILHLKLVLNSYVGKLPLLMFH